MRAAAGAGPLHPPDLPAAHHGSSRIDSSADHSAQAASSLVGGTLV
jgi:hypothetical protein